MIVWQKSIVLVTKIYSVTKSFPKEETYGLTSQIRRAAVSVPSNIAEGRRRGGETEFRQFLRIAFGSLSEVETQLEIARQLGYVPVDGSFNEIGRLIEEISRMLNSMTS